MPQSRPNAWHSVSAAGHWNFGECARSAGWTPETLSLGWLPSVRFIPTERVSGVQPETVDLQSPFFNSSDTVWPDEIWIFTDHTITNKIAWSRTPQGHFLRGPILGLSNFRHLRLYCLGDLSRDIDVQTIEPQFVRFAPHPGQLPFRQPPCRNDRSFGRFGATRVAIQMRP